MEDMEAEGEEEAGGAAPGASVEKPRYNDVAQLPPARRFLEFGNTDSANDSWDRSVLSPPGLSWKRSPNDMQVYELTTRIRPDCLFG
jgi:hypothetical protein